MFATRLRGGRPLAATFQKLPSHQVVELCGRNGLDMGAAGIFVPHLTSGEMAKHVMSSAMYREGSRGFSPSTRTGGYGERSLEAFMNKADSEVAVVLQIEDGAALDQLDAIASAKGVAGLFVAVRISPSRSAWTGTIRQSTMPRRRSRKRQRAMALRQDHICMTQAAHRSFAVGGSAFSYSVLTRALSSLPYRTQLHLYNHRSGGRNSNHEAGGPVASSRGQRIT